MIDLDERFGAADEIPAPDVWAEVQRRVVAPAFDRHPTELRDRARTRRRRIATIAAAVAIAAIGIGFAVRAFRGSETTPVNQPPVGIFDPVRGYIAYYDRQYEPAAIDPDGGNPITLDPTGGRALGAPLSWSADGTRLLLDGGTMLTEDGSVRGVVPAGGDMASAALSPDGSQVAFTKMGSLVVADTDGANDTTRVIVPRSRQRSANWPTWSPDGTRIAFLALDVQSQLVSISVVNTDGTGLHVLNRLAPMQGRGRERGCLAWSPDGSTIAMSYSPPVPDGRVLGGEVWLMDADGANLRRITRNDGSWRPTWSPDGQRLAVVRDGSIYTMAKDGGDQHFVSRGAYHLALAWNPA